MSKDDRVESALKKIDELKEGLVRPEGKFKTNRIFMFFGNSYNLGVIQNLELLSLASSVEGVIKFNTAHGYKNESIAGYPLEDWLHDFTLQMNKNIYESKRRDLVQYAAELDKMISSDRRQINRLTELEALLSS